MALLKEQKSQIISDFRRADEDSPEPETVTGSTESPGDDSAAEADRPRGQEGKSQARPGAVVTPLRWPERSKSASQALDAERRRRREAAVPVTPEPPPRLGASFRERNVFVLPDDDEEDRGPADRG